MRIYEFAKEYNIPLKTVIEKLEGAGITVKSHMSALSQEGLNALKSLIEQPTSSKPENIKVEKKVEKKSEVKKIAESKPVEKKAILEQSSNKSQPLKIAEKNEIIKPVQKVQVPPSSSVLTKTNSVTTSDSSSGSDSSEKKIFIENRSMTVAQAASFLEKPINEVILSLLKLGIAATKNQTINEIAISKLAKQYEAELIKPVKQTIQKNQLASKSALDTEESIERHPVVVVMGHVDHGKTTLLDYIRKTKVASREKGGITQHLGACQAVTSQGTIVFLDTPGHEAFVKIRERGIKVADVAILVVAADDGVMPQTIEAINQARALSLPIIVAINKIDKVDATRLETIKRQLAQQDLLPEDWGGSTICVPVSALTGDGVDKLLEMVLLQAQIMDLRARVDRPAQGFILESKIEKGRGPVATVIVQNGVINIGDYFITGQSVGHVTSLIDSFGKKLLQVIPATPVQVAGFETIPQVGDLFKIVPKQEYAKARNRGVIDDVSSMSTRLLKENAINIILKTDNKSSQEAIIDAIDRLTVKKEHTFNIIQANVGDIKESDVELAANTHSAIIGFSVKTEVNASSLAQKLQVSIELYDIIYRLLEHLEEQIAAKKKTEFIKKKIGEATVRAVFDIKDVGIIAGCYVKDGRFTKDGFVAVYRRNKKIGEGPIKSLQREKKSVKEVHAGFECGFVIEGLTDWEVDDRVECFIDVAQ